jgi:hypothetical protein
MKKPALTGSSIVLTLPNMIIPNKFKNENEYFADSEFISHSQLKQFKQCEWLYKLKHVDDALPTESHDYFDFGHAVDCLVTEPEGNFDDRFDVVARRNKDRDDGKIELTKAQHRDILECVTEFNRQPIFSMFGFRTQSNCQEIICAEIDGVKRKGKLDYLRVIEKDGRKLGIIVDVKTNRSLTYFKPEVYATQLAWYRDLALAKYPDVDSWDCYLAVVDKVSGPKRSELFLADQGTIGEAARQNDLALDKYLEAKALGVYTPITEKTARPGGNPRNEVCYECPAYSTCEFSIQKTVSVF